MASHRISPAIGERFTIGRVLVLSWRAWIACRWHLLAIVVPIAALRAVGLPYLHAMLLKSLASGWRELIGGWITVGITAPAVACLAYAVIRFADDQNMRPVDALRTCWRRIPLIVVAAVIVHTITAGPELLMPKGNSAALIAAFLTYTVCKLAVLTITFLLFAVLIMERTSVAGALDRSMELMSGHRWRIVGLMLLTWMTVSLVWYAHYKWIRPWYPALGKEVGFMVRFVIIFFAISITSFIPAAAYSLLRIEKQGASPDGVARIFD